MYYREKEALVSSINRENITVFVPCESSGKCKACASYGMCGSEGSHISHTIPTDRPETFREKETVTILLAVPPFFSSVFFVFILPLLLMLLFPAILYYGFGYTSGNETATVLAGAVGLGVGMIPGRIIDRAFSKKYPPTIKERS